MIVILITLTIIHNDNHNHLLFSERLEEEEGLVRGGADHAVEALYNMI